MFAFNIFIFLAFSLSVFDESQYNLHTQWKELFIVSGYKKKNTHEILDPVEKHKTTSEWLKTIIFLAIE